MKLRLSHSPYIAHKIAIDLINTDFVSIKNDKLAIQSLITKVINEDIEKELALDDKVLELLEENEDNIEFYRADEKQLYGMLKRKLSKEFGVSMKFDERITNLSHQILDELWEEYYIEFTVQDNKVRNIIYNAIIDYLKIYETIEIEIYEKIKNYKRRIVPGSEEYDIVFEKLYEDELQRRGML